MRDFIENRRYMAHMIDRKHWVQHLPLLAVLIILYFGSNDATEGKYRNYARRVATSPGPNISRFVLMRLDEMEPFDRIVKSLTRQ